MISLILFLLYGPMPPKPEVPSVPWKVHCDNLHDDTAGLQFIVNYPELVPSRYRLGDSVVVPVCDGLFVKGKP